MSSCSSSKAVSNLSGSSLSYSSTDGERRQRSSVGVQTLPPCPSLSPALARSIFKKLTPPRPPRTDEPEEVGVVEKQLLEHLDMDPTVTVNVLCDQVVPTEEPVDDEDRAVRDRLRALVLDFMKGPAKRGIVRNATAQRFEPENALVGRVLGVRCPICVSYVSCH